MNLFEQHLRLSDLTLLIDRVLYNNFGSNTYWVKAETSDVKNYPDRQYCFLTLVEKEGNQVIAKMDAVIWKQQYHIIREFVENTGVGFDKNISLLLRVQLGFSAQYGLRLQILELNAGYTLGAIELQKQEVLKQLVEQNPETISLINGEYITYNNQLLLPVVIQKIALITAPGSDGERDFLHELQHNIYGYQIEIDSYLTQIQGNTAAQSILEKLNLIITLGIKYDLVVIVRGGGSQLDFSAFDAYDLSLRVASFPIPIIAGIGHERNISIVDLMCYASLKTPTKAAAFIIDNNLAFEQQINTLKNRLVSITDSIIQSAKSKIEKSELILKNAVTLYFRDKNNLLNQKIISIKLLDPTHILSRGFAILKNKEGVIMNSLNLEPGNVITAITKDAELTLITQEVIPLKK
ncbi:MAG: exodeoxyribonuclease VII large subunit [Bacteroidia bacterium]|nr:exodeoxyribonuclease VII large subunit [Bacteroidia bacterium]